MKKKVIAMVCGLIAIVAGWLLVASTQYRDQFYFSPSQEYSKSSGRFAAEYQLKAGCRIKSISLERMDLDTIHIFLERLEYQRPFWFFPRKYTRKYYINFESLCDNSGALKTRSFALIVGKDTITSRCCKRIPSALDTIPEQMMLIDNESGNLCIMKKK